MLERLSYWSIVGLIVLGGLALRLWDPAPIARLRLLTFDTFQIVAPRKTDPNYPVRIVDIDEKSISALGQWPWRRDRLAELVERLFALGARAIVFDVVFPGAQDDVINLLPASVRNDQAFKALLDDLMRGGDVDKRFAEALKKGPVILGVAGRTGKQGRKPKAKAAFALLGSDHNTYLPGLPAGTGNLPVLEDAASGIGALNWFPEYDQIVRKVPMVVRIEDELFPSLSAATIRVLDGASTIVVRSSSSTGELSIGETTGITSVQIGDLDLPTDKNGQIWLAATRHDQKRYRSAVDVVLGKVAPDDIRGRIILVGSSAPGLLDLRATALDAAIPGVEVQAEALEQILSGWYLIRPDYVTGVEVALFVVGGLLLASIVYLLGALSGFMAGGVLVASLLLASWWSYTKNGVLLDPSFPVFALTGLYLFASGYAFLKAERQRNRIRGAFGQYLAPELVRRLVDEPSRLRLGGETRPLTIMFSDVRGFTRIAETYKDNPEDLTRLMNRMLGPLSQAVMGHRGTIDKYIGDAIMAFWNAPLDDPAHAANACQTGLVMCDCLAALNQERENEARTKDAPFARLRIGIGIATGQAMVGNMGSEVRFDYSALGDTVNLASRLEALTRHYDVPIILSDATCREGARGLATIEIDRVIVHGRDAPETIWALFGDADYASNHDFRQFADAFSEALSLYRAMDWPAAAAAFERSRPHADVIQASPLVELFLSRTREFTHTPPNPDWGGAIKVDK